MQLHILKDDGVSYWLDSVIVLQWLHSADKKQTFSLLTAAEFWETSSIDEREHIKGDMIPSDIGTRGTTIQKLSEWKVVWSNLFERPS